MTTPQPQIIDGLAKYDPPLTGLDLRGQNYLQVREYCHGTLLTLFNRCYKQHRRVTILDIGRMAVQVGLPVKTACEFLEQFRLIPPGTWERKGYTSQQILEAIHAD